MIEDHGEPDDSEGSKENLSREWVYGVAYLISPVLFPIFTGEAGKLSGGDWVMTFILGWLFFLPLAFGYFTLVYLALYGAIDSVESRLPLEWSKRTKRVIAIIIGIPIGVLILILGFSDY